MARQTAEITKVDKREKALKQQLDEAQELLREAKTTVSSHDRKLQSLSRDNENAQSTLSSKKSSLDALVRAFTR